MTHEPRIYVQVSEKVNTGNYGHREITIGLSGLPFGASDEDIQHGLGTAQRAIELTTQAIRGKIAQVRREPAREADLKPVDETGIDISAFGADEPRPAAYLAHEAIEDDGVNPYAETCVGCGVVMELASQITKTDLGPACDACLGEVLEKISSGEQVRPSPVHGATGSVPETRPDLSGGSSPAETAKTDPPAVESKPAPSGPDVEKNAQIVPPAAGHVEGCCCANCAPDHDHFADENDGKHVKGCLCGRCKFNNRVRCSVCGKERPIREMWRELTESCIVICPQCDDQRETSPAPEPEKSTVTDVFNQVKAAAPAQVSGHEIDDILGCCKKCGLELLTTECPGSPVTAMQGQHIVAGKLDFVGGAWKVAGCPGDTHQFPGATPVSELPASSQAGAAPQGVTSPKDNGADAASSPAEAPESLPPTAGVEAQVAETPAKFTAEQKKAFAAGEVGVKEKLGPEIERSFIPGDGDVQTTLTAFGIDVPIPPLEWALEPITEVNADGTGGGQLKALNTILGLTGYKGKDRHWATLALLHGLFGPLRTSIDSLRDLKANEAHAVLEWLTQAEGNTEAKSQLFAAASALKGQIPLRLAPELAGVAS